MRPVEAIDSPVEIARRRSRTRVPRGAGLTSTDPDRIVFLRNYDLASGNETEHQHYIPADASNGQVEAGNGRCKPAEHQRENDDVPGRPRAHPGSEIDPMEPVKEPPIAARRSVGALQERATVRIDIVPCALIVA